MSDAERVRLVKALESGPWRRMAADRARGLTPQRADMVQARQYTRLVEALDAGMDEERGEVGMVGDVLALDRTERD